MGRKTIAVCVTGYDWEYESRIVNGIFMRCRELDINLLVFSNLKRKPELNSDRVLPESVIWGEMEIFKLINYDTVDGIIIIGESILDENVIGQIYEQAKLHGIPAVNVNDSKHVLSGNVLLSDKRAMEFVMSHLVEDHGFTKINFIGGFPGNLQTEERLAAYKKILSEHNIPIEEDRIAYGEFWKRSIDCTNKFLDAPELPQAIVCASDTMAIFCMDTIKERGLRIPEDIVVTGFDGIKDCELYSPTITSVRRGFNEAGIAAVDVLADLWSGRSNAPVTVNVDSVLVRNGSCGCASPAKSKNFFNSFYDDQNNLLELSTDINEMNSKFANAATSAELFAETKKIAKFFKLNKLYICICASLEHGQVSIDDSIKAAEYSGLSDKMFSMVEYGHNVPVGSLFDTAELVPENYADGEKPAFLAFSPLYFKTRFLGYLAYEPSTLQGSGTLFETWITNISHNADSFYMNKALEYVIDELKNLYIRDPLTGLYNRRGMNLLGSELISEACRTGKDITVICADIDNLKPINDKFGHEGGDNTIIHTAKALEASMPDGSICVRTGGDEFCVLFSGNTDAADCIKAMEKYLDDYNKNSGLPYCISCSCGFARITGAKFESVDPIMKAADENMYKVKAAKKTARR